MRRFIFSGIMVCPSNWTGSEAAAFVERQLLSTQEEKNALMVTELGSPLQVRLASAVDEPTEEVEQ